MSRRIQHVKRHAININPLAHDIAGRTRIGVTTAAS